MKAKRFLAIAGLLLAAPAGCGDEPPPPVATPEAAPEPARAAKEPAEAKRAPTPMHLRKIDELGRIRPAADRIYGFHIPMDMRLLAEGKGYQVYDLVGPAARLVEFYTHREYTVVKEPASHVVRHTRRTLDGQPVGLYDEARVVIIMEASNRARLRFSVPTGPQNRLNPLNAEVDAAAPNERAAAARAVAPDAPRVQVTPSRVQGSGGGRAVTSPEPPEEAAPHPELLRPAGEGRMDASEAVRAWMRENPGRTFQD